MPAVATPLPSSRIACPVCRSSLRNYGDGEISRTVTGDAPLPRIGVPVQPVAQPAMLMTVVFILPTFGPPVGVLSPSGFRNSCRKPMICTGLAGLFGWLGWRSQKPSLVEVTPNSIRRSISSKMRLRGHTPPIVLILIHIQRRSVYIYQYHLYPYLR